MQASNDANCDNRHTACPEDDRATLKEKKKENRDKRE